MGLEIVGAEIGVASSARDWYDLQWQLVQGCTRVTEGCEHCTAEIITARSPRQQRFATLRGGPHKARWTGRVETLDDALAAPARWPTPLWVFVCSMSDLFHEKVPFEFIARALEVMGAHPQHTFGLCTKRADRMVEVLDRFGPVPDNVMVGVTVENNDRAAQRVSKLKYVQAKVRWVAAEPMLGPVWLGTWLGTVVNWVTFGPEIGEGRRKCDVEWARRLLADCREANVPFFTKHNIDDEEIRERPCATV